MSLLEELRFYSRHLLVPPATGAQARRRRAIRLPALAAQLSETSVSGVSSGGAMAIQLHIAHSRHMKGAGITAGVAYDSADSRQALVPRIMRGYYKSINGIAHTQPSAAEVAQFSIERTKEALKAGGIDHTSHLQNQRVWLFHGTKDIKVAKEAMDGVQAYYLNYVKHSNVFYMNDLAAPHAQINDDYGNPENHIIDFNYDTPRRLLQLIYGTLDDNGGVYERGNLIAFDQSEFVGYMQDGRFKHVTPERVGLADTGYIYIPSHYEPHKGRLHVAFHGCDQYADETMGFVRDAGYNEWAEKNNIVMLYPQTIGTSVPLNPKGCWDWFGYAAPTDYRSQFARKDGYQIGAIWRMIERLCQGAQVQPHGDFFARPLRVQGDATDISVALVWKQNLAVECFNVYCKGPRDTDFQKISKTPVFGFSYVDRPLESDTEYKYQVKSFHRNHGVSAASDTLTIRTLPKLR